MTNIAVASAVVKKVTGPQVIEVDGFGPPVAALILGTGHAGTGVSRTAANSWAVTDGVQSRSTGNVARDAGPSSATWWRSENSCYVLPDEGGGVGYSAAFIQWTANGIEINWNTVNVSMDATITVVLFGGEITDAHVGEHSLGNTPGAPQRTYTGAPFQGDLLFTAQQYRKSTWIGNSVAYQPSYGFACDDLVNGIMQATQSQTNRNAQSTSQNGLSWSDLSMLIAYSFNGNRYYEVKLDNFESDGFTYTVDSAQASGGTNTIMSFLILKMPADTRMSIQQRFTRQIVGVESYPCGFKPVFVMNLAGTILPQPPPPAVTITASHGIGWGVMDENVQNAQFFHDEDGVLTMSCASLNDNGNFISWPDINGGAFGWMEAERDSFDDNGYNLNYTNPQGSALPFLDLAIGESGDEPPPVVDNAFLIT